MCVRCTTKRSRTERNSRPVEWTRCGAWALRKNSRTTWPTASIDMLFYNTNIDQERYFIATYEMSSTANLKEAAWALAIGQSVGNPSVRNKWETEALFENHSCVFVGEKAKL